MATKRHTTDARKQSEPHIYQLYVELCDIAPAIWRRLQVPSWITLAKLHHVLQIAMGWTNSHLHQFDIAGKHYGIPDEDWPEMSPVDERHVILANCLGMTVTDFSYEYDFGDGWEHSVHVERILPVDDLSGSLLCMGGANACPPEDVGGPPGYFDFVQAITDPSRPGRVEMLRWYGGAFDPARFDLNAVNASLHQVKISSRRQSPDG